MTPAAEDCAQMWFLTDTTPTFPYGSVNSSLIHELRKFRAIFPTRLQFPSVGRMAFMFTSVYLLTIQPRSRAQELPHVYAAHEAYILAKMKDDGKFFGMTLSEDLWTAHGVSQEAVCAILVFVLFSVVYSRVQTQCI
jgi:hypothetical protein